MTQKEEEANLARDRKRAKQDRFLRGVFHNTLTRKNREARIEECWGWTARRYSSGNLD